MFGRKITPNPQPSSAADKALEIAALEAGLATLPPADAARLTRSDVEFLARNIRYDVQTARLHSYGKH